MYKEAEEGLIVNGRVAELEFRAAEVNQPIRMFIT